MSFRDRDAARLREAAKAALEELRPAGFGLGVVSKGDLVVAEGLGFADIETGRTQDPRLRQRIGSITKTMVGLCVMALVEEGRLCLDAPLSDLVPEVAVRGDASGVTVRRLLSHTAGVGEVPTVEDLRDVDATLWSSEPGDDVPGLFPAGLTLGAAPGTLWCYANLGYALLGEIVSRIEGAPIAEVMRRRIFEPLGMADSDLLDRPHAHLSTPYHHPPTADAWELAARLGRTIPDEPTVDGANIRGRYLHIRGVAAGAVQSTIPDMARYAAALLTHGGGVLSPASFAAMLAPQWRPDPRFTGWGLSFILARAFGEPSFGHTGGVLGGWNTLLNVFPRRGLAILVHANTAFEGSARLFQRLTAALLDAPAPPPGEPPSREAAEAIEGVYEAPGSPLVAFRAMGQPGRIQVRLEAGEPVLYARRGPWKTGVRVHAVGPAQPDLLQLEDSDIAPTRLAVVRDSTGAVSRLRFESSLIEMAPADPARAWL